MANIVGSVGSGQTAYNTVSSPELAQLQKQLSNSVNDSESARTFKGQAQIGQLGLRIAALQWQQQQAEQVDAPKAPPPARPSDGPLGTKLDVYA